MPADLLTTIAECAIAFAGFSALAVIIPQLAGVPWRGQMATGLWLMVSWSLSAFFFALLPLVLLQLGVSAHGSVSWSSGTLAAAILVQAALAGNRDRKLARQGRAQPTERIVFVAAAFGVLIAAVLILNALGALPGGAAGWYVLGILSLFGLAAVPLSLFLQALGSSKG
jgi:hypothetical protein